MKESRSTNKLAGSVHLFRIAASSLRDLNIWRKGWIPCSPFGEAGCDVVVDIGKLGLEIVGLLQDLLGALVGVLPSRHQLAARL
jgi:hypothetical protein